MKLLAVERTLTLFDRKNSDLVSEYPIKLEVTDLKEIVKQRKGDELLYLPYILNQSQAKSLIKRLGIELLVETKTYTYVLECNGIY
ncbi:DUF7683 domain-containing protein [Mucilaginibacter glaciei]|uniref:DUF7683 domain-containing protein n=1 Tax=Mucilaginibacter glaciei TaxID=2772109 RepID=A0A926NVW5_9SPHI|nr:hypothetical protein [Mucilaginibacter glaciei]